MPERDFESALGPGCQPPGPYGIEAAEWTRLNAFIAKLVVATSTDQGYGNVSIFFTTQLC